MGPCETLSRALDGNAVNNPVNWFGIDVQDMGRARAFH
jgi:hypothetical protein